MANPDDLDRGDWLRAANLERKRRSAVGGLNLTKLDRDDWLYLNKSHWPFYFLRPEPTFGRMIFVFGLTGLGYGVWYVWNHFSSVWQYLTAFVR